MVPFLLIISFLLHIITLFALFQFLKQQQSSKQSDSQDVMEVLEVYLNEIREENSRLEHLLAQQKGQVEKDSSIDEQAEKKTDHILSSSEVNQLDALLKNASHDQVNASLESKVLQLHAKGNKVEEIAKQLNCGKTEVELIIKLYQK